MKKITLQRLSLENFKCHRSLMLDFRSGSASIYGDNAAGKTSIYDALTWLLFGKDSLGNGEKNMEIKPLNASGEVLDHDAVTSVEAVLRVDGEEVSLRRTYQEVWSTRRGSSEAVFDGNTSEYYVDGVPCKKFAFQDRVDEIVSQDTWLMLTSVSYFAKDLPWQKRREILFKICGTMEDKAIMGTREDFAPLLAAMGKHSLDDFKAKLLSQKRGFVGARNEIPARINECQKTVDDLRAIDFDGVRAEVDILTERSEELSARLLSIDNSTAADGKRVELREAQLELDKLESENKDFRDAQIKPRPDTSGLRNALVYAERRLGNAQESLRRHEKSVARYDADIRDARENWMQVSAETFHGAGKCPTCGQALPADQIQAAKDGFEAQKNRRLSRIESDADYAKKRKADAEEEAWRARDVITDASMEIANLKSQIDDAEGMREPAEIRDMDGYRDRADGIRRWINSIQEDLRKLREDSRAAGEDLRRELSAVKGKISENLAILGKQDTLSYARRRIDQLRAEAAEGAAKLEEIEKLLFLMDEFVRYKTSFVEDSVNSRFRLARFRLFREQANGGVEDRCDVVYNGIPYMNLNNGARINVGIDIINTLTEAYGVEVPLFIDNAESVTRLEEYRNQTIRLVVSAMDKELRIDYEN